MTLIGSYTYLSDFPASFSFLFFLYVKMLMVMGIFLTLKRRLTSNVVPQSRSDGYNNITYLQT